MTRIGTLARRTAPAVRHGIHRVDARCDEDRSFAVRIAALAIQLAREKAP